MMVDWAPLSMNALSGWPFTSMWTYLQRGQRHTHPAPCAAHLEHALSSTIPPTYIPHTSLAPALSLPTGRSIAGMHGGACYIGKRGMMTGQHQGNRNPPGALRVPRGFSYWRSCAGSSHAAAAILGATALSRREGAEQAQRVQRELTACGPRQRLRGCAPVPVRSSPSRSSAESPPPAGAAPLQQRGGQRQVAGEQQGQLGVSILPFTQPCPMQIRNMHHMHSHVVGAASRSHREVALQLRES